GYGPCRGASAVGGGPPEDRRPRARRAWPAKLRRVLTVECADLDNLVRKYGGNRRGALPGVAAVVHDQEAAEGREGIGGGLELLPERRPRRGRRAAHGKCYSFSSAAMDWNCSKAVCRSSAISCASTSGSG